MKRFNEKGAALFANALAQLTASPEPTEQDYIFVRSLASNRDLCEDIDGAKQLPAGPFKDRFELCSKIYHAISETEVIEDLDPADTCWSWLTARYFNELTTYVRKDGSPYRKLSKEQEAPAYVWHSNYKKAYRHRIGHGIFIIHNLGETLARPMLLSHPGSMSDYCEQTFARVGSYKEKAVIEAAHSIYTEDGKAIRGASSSRRWGLRHLHREVAQCLVNYEMHEMNTNELLAFLPADFKKRGFLSWVPDAKLAAYLMLKLPDSWQSLFAEDDQDQAKGVLCDLIGCTKADLSNTLAEAKALDDEESDRKWLGNLEEIAEEYGDDDLNITLAAIITEDKEAANPEIQSRVEETMG